MARRASGIEMLDQAKEILSKAKTVNELFDYHFYSAMLILKHVKDYPDRMEV